MPYFDFYTDTLTDQQIDDLNSLAAIHESAGMRPWDAAIQAVKDKLQEALEYQAEIRGLILEAATKKEIDAGAHQAATSPKNNKPEPTPAQQAAGNYAKGSVYLYGLEIAIENPEGSTRKGVSPDGKAWESRMFSHYGYIRRTEGADGDHVDVFLGSFPESDKVFVVDQVNPDGKFDEHKVMMAFRTLKDARKGYLKNYEEGWQGLGAITEMTVEEFKTWLKDGNTLKPVDGAILEAAAAVRTPLTPTENIQRGTEAMKRVIASHANEPRAMYRKDLGWIAFYWGTPGAEPPVFNDPDNMLEWWRALKNRFGLFAGGSGVSHIIAKRDWEGQFIQPLLGQSGLEFVKKIPAIIAKGKVSRAAGGRAIIEYVDYEVTLSLNRFGKDEVWLVSGCEKVDRADYKLINEASGDSGLSQIQPKSTHIRATLSRPDMGAGILVNSTLPLPPDAVKPVLEGATGQTVTLEGRKFIITQDSIDSFDTFKKNFSHVYRNMGPAKEAMAKRDWNAIQAQIKPAYDYRTAIEQATTFEDIQAVFARVFPGKLQTSKQAKWVKDYSSYTPIDTAESHWGKGQAGFTIAKDGTIFLSDNSKIKKETQSGEKYWGYPDHRDIEHGEGNSATIYSGIYSFGHGKPVLWLYPDAEKALNEEMKKGLASLIGVHKITGDTEVKSNTTRKTLFKLSDYAM